MAGRVALSATLWLLAASPALADQASPALQKAIAALRAE
jgi:hypothetical protein